MRVVGAGAGEVASYTHGERTSQSTMPNSLSIARGAILLVLGSAAAVLVVLVADPSWPGLGGRGRGGCDTTAGGILSFGGFFCDGAGAGRSLGVGAGAASRVWESDGALLHHTLPQPSVDDNAVQQRQLLVYNSDESTDRDRSADLTSWDAGRGAAGSGRALQSVGSGREDGFPLMGVNAGGPRVFPPVEKSTVMFLHVFKCAGSTLRRMLVDWARVDGQGGAVVHACDYTTEEEEMCLDHYELVDEAVQREQISRLKVLAGHFIWGFQRHVQGPYLMITCLRNPLEAYVSGQQYLRRRKTKTLEKAKRCVSSAMKRRLAKLERDKRGPTGTAFYTENDRQLGGFIRRFVGQDQKRLRGKKLGPATDEALKNLSTFWIVGVVEQYDGFLEVLRRSLDPDGKHTHHWQNYTTMHYNTSPISSREVLTVMNPSLVRRFNASLSLQWRVYERAVHLWDVRCREVLPETMHDELCTVRSPQSAYL